MGRLSVGLVAISCVAMASKDVSAECLPTAVSAGDPALVQRIGEKLTANGIAISPTVGCPAVHVQVARNGEALVLEMTDSFLRRGRREVRDVATAAAVIESWTLQEIEQGALPEVDAGLTEIAPTMTMALTQRSGVAATFESSLGSDGSLWLGGSIAGCARRGPICVGGIVRGARDTHALGGTKANAPRHGQEINALATVDLPKQLGSFVVSPGVGIGYGLVNVTSSHLDMRMMPFSVEETSHALRADVHVMITRPLGGRMSLYGELHGDAAITRTDIGADGPLGFVRVSLGIRLEAP